MSTASLANHFLVAMPNLHDPSFRHAVVYVCEHQPDGAVGLIVNHPMEYPMKMVFDQLKIPSEESVMRESPVMFGGPVQPERGFVIHRPQGNWRSSLLLQQDVTVTTSNDIIRAIAGKDGPKDVLVALGFAGWSEKQLDEEILANSWLVCPYNSELMYEVPYDKRWEYAGSILGIRINELGSQIGHA